MVPELIGRYTIVRELGRGGMAIVYLADDPGMKRQVAIKVLPRELSFEEIFRARFQREAEVIASLEHAHIVPLYDFGEHDDQPYLVMRYMPGGSLADRIREGSFSLAEAAAILEPIADALDEAHQEGIIHRDVKPSNVLFDKRRSPFLSDFGIVKLTEATAQLTGGGIVGTPAYMAPEMGMSGGLSPLIDIYALAVTLYEMLSGKAPFQADTPMGVLMAHMNLPIPDIRQTRSELPENVQWIIERGMAKKPEERYQSAHEMAADVRALSVGQPISIGLAAPSPNLSPEYASAPSAMKVGEPSPAKISPDRSGADSPFRPGAPSPVWAAQTAGWPVLQRCLCLLHGRPGVSVMAHRYG